MASITHQTTASYEPPRGMAPSLARARLIGGYDTRTFAVAILSLVQDGLIAMKPEPDASIRLTRTAHAWSPRDTAAQWLLKALVGKSDFVLGKRNYVRLLRIRQGHAEQLLRDSNRQAGNGGAFIMAGFGLVVALAIGTAAVAARAPMHMSAAEILLPYWPVPVTSIAGLWFWRRTHMRAKTAKLKKDAEEIERYRRYIKIAQADRLNPKFAADGAYKSHDQDTVYAAAFGLDNAWADPVVHLLEGLLPGTVEETGISAEALTDKRGFAPRPQPRHRWPSIWTTDAKDYDG